MWMTIFYSMLIAGFLLLTTGIVLALHWDIFALQNELSGRTSRNRIKKLERINQTNDGPSTTDLYNTWSSKPLDDLLEDVHLEEDDEDRGLRGILSRRREMADVSTSESTGEHGTVASSEMITGRVDEDIQGSDPVDYSTSVWESGFADESEKSPFSADRSVAILFERSSLD